MFYPPPCLSLQVLDLSNNKLSQIPADLSDCSKLKEIHFKGNKLKDKRLEKMVNGCQTKSILDYLRAGGRGMGKGKQGEDRDEPGRNAERKKRQHKKKKEEDEVEELNKMVVKVLHVADGPTAFMVKVTGEVKDVRPYLVCCLVKGMILRPGNALKRFLMAQVRSQPLQDTIQGTCNYRDRPTHAKQSP